MSYQVLARKWRPSTFAEMVGQTHVLKALINALDQERLHHAYLFTGTRGVGKTTIARLLAKSLNCEVGVSSRPCGECSACREIAEGRFVDLIEVDAASRTRVEDTRELLENVQYAPTRGRYKVYLIDEVHMLSVSSFNALLKTLEEPPPHVKFLLATTDPQKLPVTVLSRCLQFNLKNMTRESIVEYLHHILKEEQVSFDEPALWLLAEAAQGSMRDALSLTDQAIAFGEGQLRETDVAAMLGTVDLKRVLNLVRGLIEKDAPALMQQVADIAEHAPDYGALLNELLSTLHRVAIGQAAPTALDNSKGDLAAIQALAQAGQPEDIHLFYQLGTAASKDMSLAPSERAGFEMTLLRMLAFSPTPPKQLGDLPPLVSQSSPATMDGAGEASVSNGSAEASGEPDRAIPDTTTDDKADPTPDPSNDAIPEPVETPESDSAESAPAESSVAQEPITPDAQSPANTATMPARESEQAESPVAEPERIDTEPAAEPRMADDAAQLADVDRSEAAHDPEPDQAPPWDEPQEPDPAASQDIRAATIDKTEPDTVQNESIEPASQTVATSTPADLAAPAWPELDFEGDPKHWWQVTLHKLGLSGMTKTVFAHSEWQGYRDGRVTLLISMNYRNVMNETQVMRLREALVHELPDLTAIDTEFGAAERTPQLWLDQLNHAAWEKAVAELQQDDFIRQLTSDFSAELQTDTVKPVHNPLPTGA